MKKIFFVILFFCTTLTQGWGDTNYACSTTNNAKVRINQIYNPQIGNEVGYIELYVDNGPVNLEGWQICYSGNGTKCVTIGSGNATVYVNGASIGNDSDASNIPDNAFLVFNETLFSAGGQPNNTFVQAKGEAILLDSSANAAAHYLKYRTSTFNNTTWSAGSECSTEFVQPTSNNDGICAKPDFSQQGSQWDYNCANTKGVYNLGVSVSDATPITEGNSGTKSVEFIISLSSTSTLPVTVNFMTEDGTATAVSGDFVANSGTLTFAPGETSKSISVAINGDLCPETDEQFGIKLSNASVAIIDGTAVATITNDDIYPTVDINDVTQPEGNSATGNSVAFTISITCPFTTPIDINYATSDGTAKAGKDFTNTYGTITIPVGATSATVSVPILGNTKFEPNKYFYLDIINVENGELGKTRGVAMLTNDDTSFEGPNWRDFTKVFGANANGDVRIIGNTVSCRNNNGTCADPGGNNNNAIDILFSRVDTTVSFNNSMATLNLPAGSEVLFAKLYWQGYLRGTGWASSNYYAKGNSGTTLPKDQAIYVKFKKPGDTSYTTITAEEFNWVYHDNSLPPNQQYFFYQGSTDITNMINKTSPNGNYYVGDIKATAGTPSPGGGFAGWAIVIAYKNLNDSYKNLTVFDGYFDIISSGGDATVGEYNEWGLYKKSSFPISGFLTPKSGTIKSTFLWFGGEGDYSYTGDSLGLTKSNGSLVSLSNTLNQANNIANSSITYKNNQVATRNPNYPNAIGVDIDDFDISNVLDFCQNSTNVVMTSSGEGYFPGVFAFSTDVTPETLCYNIGGVFNATHKYGIKDFKDDGTPIGEANLYTSATDISQTIDIVAKREYLPNSIVIDNQTLQKYNGVIKVELVEVDSSNECSNFELLQALDYVSFNKSMQIQKTFIPTKASKNATIRITYLVNELEKAENWRCSNQTALCVKDFLNNVRGDTTTCSTECSGTDFTTCAACTFDPSKGVAKQKCATDRFAIRPKEFSIGNISSGSPGQLYSVPTKAEPLSYNSSYNQIVSNNADQYVKKTTYTNVECSANPTTTSMNNINYVNGEGYFNLQFPSGSTSSKVEIFDQYWSKSSLDVTNGDCIVGSYSNIPNTDGKIGCGTYGVSGCYSSNMYDIIAWELSQGATPPTTPKIYTKIANNPFSIYVGPKTGKFTGTICVNIDGETSWSGTYLNDAESKTISGLNSTKAIKSTNIKLRYKPAENAIASCGGSYGNSAGSSDSFAIRPASFDITATEVKAGENLNIASTAKGSGESLLSGSYNGSANLDISITDSTKTCEVNTKDGFLDNPPSPLSFAYDTNNSSIRTKDIGDITIKLTDNTWTSVDSPDDCILDSNTTNAVNGKVGCNVENTVTTKITPYQFKVTNPLAVPTWKYMVSSLSEHNSTYGAKIEAQSSSGNITKNFTDGCFSEDVEVDFNFALNQDAKLSYIVYGKDGGILGSEINKSFDAGERKISFTQNAALFGKNGDINGTASFTIDLAQTDRMQNVKKNPTKLTLKNFNTNSETSSNIPHTFSTTDVTTFLYGRIAMPSWMVEYSNATPPPAVRAYAQVYATDKNNLPGGGNWMLAPGSSTWWINRLHESSNGSIEAVLPRASSKLSDNNTTDTYAGITSSVLSNIFGGVAQIGLSMNSTANKDQKITLHLAVPEYLWYGSKAYSYIAGTDCSQHPCGIVDIFGTGSSSADWVGSGDNRGDKAIKNIPKGKRVPKINW